jgi:sec-independent protein translocase protein TatA
MFDIGGPELLVIILAVVVLFGPKKIPEVAQMIGKGMRKVKQAQAQFQSQLDELQNEVKTATEPDKPFVKTNHISDNYESAESHIDPVYENAYKYNDKKNVTNEISDTIDNSEIIPEEKNGHLSE